MYYVSVMIEVPPTLAVCTIIKFGQDDFVAPGMDQTFWVGVQPFAKHQFFGLGHTISKTRGSFFIPDETIPELPLPTTTSSRFFIFLNRKKTKGIDCMNVPISGSVVSHRCQFTDHIHVQ